MMIWGHTPPSRIGFFTLTLPPSAFLFTLTLHKIAIPIQNRNSLMYLGGNMDAC
jgi:hypothetical protein